MCSIKLSKTPCPNLEQQFQKETGQNALYGDDPASPPSLLYVEWLEAKVEEKTNIDAFIESGDFNKVIKNVSKWNKILMRRKRNLEIKKRISRNVTTTCSDCEYGKYHPCNYKHWGFEIRSNDPSCKDFEPWGCVW